MLNTHAGLQTVRSVQMLAKQTMAHHLEIFIVDNHSSDDSIGTIRNRLQQFPQVRILENRANFGFGKGYATGIRQALGKYVLINNPDKLLPPDALEKMMAVMDRDESIGIMGPRLMHDDGTTRLSARAFPKLWDVFIKRTPLQRLFKNRMKQYLQLDAQPDVQRDVDWLVGGCLLVRREVLEQLGGFDGRFFLFFEDIDLCRRCWESGKRVVYFPQVKAADRKKRLSEMSAFAMPFKKVGRAHIASAMRYFWKWKFTSLPR